MALALALALALSFLTGQWTLLQLQLQLQLQLHPVAFLLPFTFVFTSLLSTLFTSLKPTPTIVRLSYQSFIHFLLGLYHVLLVMASFSYDDYSDSPTMLCSPQQHHFPRPSYKHSRASFPLSYSNQSRFSPSNSDLSTEPLAPIVSRKRSRDEDDDHLTSPSHKPSQEPIHGESMALIDPLSNQATSAETQTGIWFEDGLETEGLAVAQATELLIEPENDKTQWSRVKKQCKRSCSGANTLNQSKASSPDQVKPSVKLGIDPAIEALSDSLGTGWKALSGDMAVRAGSRGWAVFIDRHYSAVTDVEVVLQLQLSKAYLVRTNKGFFLFSEDLKRGQLVAQTWETAIANLSKVPNVFQGTQILVAGSTPVPSPPEPGLEPEDGIAGIASPAAMDID